MGHQEQLAPGRIHRHHVAHQVGRRLVRRAGPVERGAAVDPAQRRVAVPLLPRVARGQRGHDLAQPVPVIHPVIHLVRLSAVTPTGVSALSQVGGIPYGARVGPDEREA